MVSNSAAYMRAYRRDRYNVRKAVIFDALGNRCAKCGVASKNSVLEVDHIDSRTKSFEVMAACWWMREDRLMAEVKKCQLLCEACHREKSVLDMGNVHAKGTHGTLSSYRYCHCSICRKAKNEYIKKWRREIGAVTGAHPRTGLVHGTSNAYAYYRCRCDACRAAHRDRHRKYRGSRKVTAVEVHKIESGKN